MTNKTRDELLLAIAAGLETLLSDKNTEDAKDAGMRLLKYVWLGQKENRIEEDERARKACS